jgi:putative transposase
LRHSHIEGVTDDDVRPGTTTLFAALDIANGLVLPQGRARPRHQEFLGFLKPIEAKVVSQCGTVFMKSRFATQPAESGTT